MELAENKKNQIPLYATSVQAGFPSPADDFVEKRLDLNEYLVDRPEATFFVRARGDSMTGAGIYDGDILVVDRSCSIQPGNIIVAVIDGELTVKRLLVEKNKAMILAPENPTYEPIPIRPGSDFGEIAYPLETNPPSKQSIVVSRSFPKPVRTLKTLKGAVSHFAERAGEKLRAQGLLASGLMVYLRTDRYLPDPYCAHTHVAFAVPVHQSKQLVKAAIVGLNRLFRPGLPYKKLGISLSGIIDLSRGSATLFSPYDTKSEAMQKAQDAINNRYGRGTLHVANRLYNEWVGGKNALSSRYTTVWEELPEVC